MPLVAGDRARIRISPPNTLLWLPAGLLPRHDHVRVSRVGGFGDVHADRGPALRVHGGWKRNIYIAMLVHCSANTVGAASALIAFVAG